MSNSKIKIHDIYLFLINKDGIRKKTQGVARNNPNILDKMLWAYMNSLRESS